MGSTRPHKTESKSATGELARAERLRKIRELHGKYAGALPSVDEFLRVKHAETDAGEREWEKIIRERSWSPGVRKGEAKARAMRSGRRGGLKKVLPTNHVLIERMVRRIVRQFHPEQVILFGSHARGQASPDSDVDLLVVMDVHGSRREKAIEIGVAMHDFDVPVDVVVVRPQDFEWRKDYPGTIERPAYLEGRTLYARDRQSSRPRR